MHRFIQFLSLLVCSHFSKSDWMFMYHGRPQCFPQTTPLNGEKWCNFTNMPNERNAICYFSCNKGFIMLGAEENQCLENFEGTKAHFVPTHGTCEPIFHLSKGENGPFFIYSNYNQTVEEFKFNQESHLLTTISNNTNGSTPFYLKIPGFNEIDGTASILIAAISTTQKNLENISKVIANDGKANILSFWPNYRWKDAASFWISEGKFKKGYVTFQLFDNPTKYLYNNGDSFKFSGVNNNEDQTKASFLISKRRIKIEPLVTT